MLLVLVLLLLVHLIMMRMIEYDLIGVSHAMPVVGVSGEIYT